MAINFGTHKDYELDVSAYVSEINKQPMVRMYS